MEHFGLTNALKTIHAECYDLVIWKESAKCGKKATGLKLRGKLLNIGDDGLRVKISETAFGKDEATLEKGDLVGLYAQRSNLLFHGRVKKVGSLFLEIENVAVDKFLHMRKHERFSPKTSLDATVETKDVTIKLPVVDVSLGGIALSVTNFQKHILEDKSCKVTFEPNEISLDACPVGSRKLRSFEKEKFDFATDCLAFEFHSMNQALNEKLQNLIKSL